MSRAIFTIVAKNYLSYARVLMNSVRRQDPDIRCFVILADQIEGKFDPRSEPFEVILSESLGIPESEWFHFKYSILELSTAIKPFAFAALQSRYNIDSLLYFDPDIEIFAPLDPLFEALESGSLLLTPHLTKAISGDFSPGEIEILRSGSYNLGFLGVRRSPEAQHFLSWWQRRLFDLCLVDPDRGLFVDQKWMDLAPGLFPGTVIMRDPRYNVAYWNLPYRKLAKSGDAYLVEGLPLGFFHFSGFDPLQPEQFTKHRHYLNLASLPVVTEISSAYAAKVLAAGYRETRHWPWVYGRFDNGVPVPNVIRPMHHVDQTVMQQVANPFSSRGFGRLVDFWNDRVIAPDGRTSDLSRLAMRVYQSRSDVQQVMPRIWDGDQQQFLHWFSAYGRREHGIDEAFLKFQSANR